MPNTERDYTERAFCLHAELQFDSGDFYIRCNGCGSRWATVDSYDAVARWMANQGAGSKMTGFKRYAPPPTITHYHPAGDEEAHT